MNRQLSLFAFLLAIAPLHLSAQSNMALPQLKVWFEAKISADMSYSNGSMELTSPEGHVVKMPAKFKTRGATAKEYLMKPSLNMKLRTSDYSEEADSALLGMRSCSSWILDAMAIDRICMRNRVAFDIWNQFSHLPYETNFGGRNGTEGRFVELYINDQYYGIYCLSDRINRKLLNLKKVKEQPDGTQLVRGVLYKSGTQDIRNQNSPCFSDDYVACVVEWHNAWELSFPEDNASPAIWEPLQDAILNGNSLDYVKKYFFLENLADYQLHVMALAITDNWGNKNHFFSIRNINKDIDDPDPTESERRRFVVTPWDLDTSLGGSYNGSYYNGTYTEWKPADIAKGGFYPFSVLQGNKEYVQLLKQRWIVARKGAFAVDSVCNRLESYRDLFLQSGAWQRMVDHFETIKYKPCYVKDLAHEVELVGQWYARQFMLMDDFFGITDAIHTIQAKDAEHTIYDLAGRHIDHHQHPGIYIINGKKMMIR